MSDECQGHRRCECSHCVEYARVCRVIRDKAAGKPMPPVPAIDYEAMPFFKLIKKDTDFTP